MRVAAYVPDLMDRSRLQRVGGDLEVTFVSSPDELATVDADLIVVDLDRPGAVAAIPSVSGRVIGFASHVHEDVMSAARAAGCDDVLARSVFFRRVPDLLV